MNRKGVPIYLFMNCPSKKLKRRFLKLQAPTWTNMLLLQACNDKNKITIRKPK